MKRSIDTDAITHGGHTLTIKEWAARTRIPAFTIYSRLSLGWSVADALVGPVVITHNGETLSIPEWAKRTGLTTNAIQCRLTQGLPPSSILSTSKPKPPTPEHTITYQGETLTLKVWSERTGISPHVLRARRRAKWTPELILTTPIKVNPPAKPEASPVQRGVGKDFHLTEGTGGGRSEQETPEISFSAKEQVKP